MKSLSHSVVNVVAILIATLSYSTTAFADEIYVAWHSSDSSMLQACDIHNGNLIVPPSFGDLGQVSSGVAVSPLCGHVYVCWSGIGGGVVATYESDSGNYFHWPTFSSNYAAFGQPAYGICFDSTGNLYAALEDGHIARVLPDTTWDFTWGDASADHAVDLEVHGNLLYAGLSSGAPSVVTYDLSSGGAPTTLASGGRVDGIAVGPGGELYTTNQNTHEVRQWDDTYLYENSTVLGTFPGDAILDVDYCNGCLYVTGKTQIHKYDLVNGTWSELVDPGPADYSQSGGYGYRR